MKKFILGCMKIALALVIVGLVFLLVGKYFGRNITETVRDVTGGKVEIRLDRLTDFGVSVSERISRGVSEVIEGKNGLTVHYELEEVTTFDKDRPVLKGSVEKQQITPVVKDISIEVGGCNFTISDSGDSFIYVEGENLGKLQIYTEQNKLYVRSITGSSGLHNPEGGRITLYLPYDYDYGELSVELGAGTLNMEQLRAHEIDLELGAGKLVAKQLTAEEIEASVGAGDMELNGFTADEIKLEVGLGNIEAKGLAGDLVEAQCAMGNLELTLEGEKEDFNYVIDGAMGKLTIGNESFSGLTDSRRISHNASKKIKVSCSMGSVNIQFTEQ